jgi:hypothetical protein
LITAEDMMPSAPVGIAHTRTRWVRHRGDGFLVDAATDIGDAGRLAALVVGWYRKAPWNDAELAAGIRESCSVGGGARMADSRQMLESLGEAGRRVLDEWDGRSE